MDFRTYIEEEDGWMWVYGDSDLESVNMEHVVTIRLQGDPDKVMVIATTILEEEIVLKTCHSGGEARDWVKHLLASINDRT